MTISVKKSTFSVWKVFLTVFTILVITIAAITGIVVADTKNIDIDSEISVTIPDGAGSYVVSEILSENGAIKYPAVFRVLSKLGGFDGQYKPGQLTLHKNMSYKEILNMLVVSDRNTISVTIPEGYTIKQIAKTLSESGICGKDDFYGALNPNLYEYKFLSDIREREMKLEGYLFPATYEFAPSSDPQTVVNTMLEAFDETFKPEYYDRAAQMNRTVDEIITMASIIERETNSDTERAKVAGVFYNRLNADKKLESCATVQYILGENKAVLSISDTQIDSPYNTYKYSGLPIGPIASPGEDCIKAALYPEKTDAFYFLLGNDGKHIFSKTYEEHQKAMEANGL